MKKIAVIGIGRVGLPLGLTLAESGYRVYGIDIRVDFITQLLKAKLPFIEKGARPLLKKHLNKNFFPTADYSIVKVCDYIILTLGTPVDENMNPSMVQIDNALNSLKPYDKSKFLLSIEHYCLR